MSEIKPKRKPAWYWNLFYALIALWFLGGLNAVMLRDGAVLTCVAVFWALTSIPVARLIGKRDSRWIEPVWIFVVLAGMYGFIIFAVPTVKISPETTYLTEPRKQHGFGIDYFTAIEKRIEPTGPPEDNGAKLLLDHLGRSFYESAIGGSPNDDRWKYACDKLRVEPSDVPKAAFVSYKEFLDSLTPEENKTVTKCNPYIGVASSYGDDEKRIIKRFVDSNAVAIDLFVEASRKPVFYIPMIRGNSMLDTLLPGEQLLREVVRCLRIRCRYRLSEQNKDGAVEDLKAIYRIAALHRPRFFSAVAYLVDTAVLDVAENSTRSVLVFGGLTAEEMLQLKREIDPFRKPLSDAEYKNVFLGERFSALDATCGMFDGRINDIADKPTSAWEQRWKRHNMKLFRTNQMLRYVNEAFDSIDKDGVHAAAKKYDLPPAKFGLKNYAWDMMWYGTSVTLLSRYIEKVLIALLFPAIEALDATRQRREINATLTDFAFELEKYRLSNQGKYPEKLEELGSDLPNDPYSSEPFRYKNLPDGYLLYSIGPNKIDDDGKTSSSPPRDDIGLRVTI